MIKLIATDMDDTLVVKGVQEPPAEFSDLIQNISDKNITFAVASGRPYLGLKKIFEKYDHHDIVYIAENGAMIVKNEQVIYADTMSVEEVKEALNLLEGHDYSAIVLSHSKGVYLLNCDEEILDEFCTYLPESHEIIDRYDGQEEIMKISIFYLDKVNEHTFDTLNSNLYHKLLVRTSGINWLDVQSKHINKGVAIEKIQKTLGIGYEETMVFGDFYNDIEMLQNAYYSYAMKNAPDEVKSYANFVTDETCEENAVINTIKDILKI